MRSRLSALQSDLVKTTGALRSGTGVGSDGESATTVTESVGTLAAPCKTPITTQERERTFSREPQAAHRFSDLSSGDAQIQEGETRHKQEPEQRRTVAVSHAV